MRKVLGRPVILVPLGVVLLVVGVFVGLNAVGAHRTGAAVEDRVMCSSSDAHLCFEVVPATLEGPRPRGIRAVGRDWAALPVDGSDLEGFSVTRSDSERLEDVGEETVGIWVKPYDAEDPVAVELDGSEVVPTQWVGLRGVGSHVSVGLLLVGLGAALIVSGVRFVRSGNGWLRADTSTEFGSAGAALVLVPAGFAVTAVIFRMPPVVVLGLSALGGVGLLVWLGVALARRAT